MKIYLIVPTWECRGYSRYYTANAPQILAALTPPRHTVRVDDESSGETVDFDYDADLVGVSSCTPNAPRAFEIADEFRRRGKKVVMGGFHPSLRPEEALEHCDSVAIGEAELIWGQILEDVENGRLKRTYQADRLADFSEIPWQKRSVARGKRGFPIVCIQASRGCPYRCSFCTVTKFFGHTYRMRPVKDVIAEIAHLTITGQMPIKTVFFTDDNICANREYAKELFAAIAPFKLAWQGQASITAAEDDELLALAKAAGCQSLAIGLESLSEASLKMAKKNMNTLDKYVSAIRKVQLHGIGFAGLFILGFDTDDPYVFDDTLRFAKANHLEFAVMSVFTPMPGTEFFDEYKANGRLLHEDWNQYDIDHAVFRPKNFTPEELQYGRNYTYQSFYSIRSMLQRLRGSRAPKFYPLFGNLHMNARLSKLPNGNYIPPARPGYKFGEVKKADWREAASDPETTAEIEKEIKKVKEMKESARKIIAESLSERIAAFRETPERTPCTGCGRCMPCPYGVDIPKCFAVLNDYAANPEDQEARAALRDAFRLKKSEPWGASKCVGCAKCGGNTCPEGINIRYALKRGMRVFENSPVGFESASLLGKLLLGGR
ncbi:MAG: radical SAM protein [Clostridiales bacterium]|jgi:radical SAM superfamily enzyme YgiQ (UPF0313 family)|nr:radical SAM protein [Clostridiales bacterium]